MGEAGTKIVDGLQQAAAHAKAMRGTNEQWIERSNAVSRFIAGKTGFYHD